jgi:hypothetical protein
VHPQRALDASTTRKQKKHTFILLPIILHSAVKERPVEETPDEPLGEWWFSAFAL